MSAVFSNEDELHKWLRDQFSSGNSLGDLIVDAEGLNAVTAQGALAQRIKRTYEYCLASLYINEVLSDNTNISSKTGEVLKPDFLLYAPETQSIVIVELKAKKAPTREAGTETNAYAAELRSYVPFISGGDLVTVIISLDWPPLLRHFIAQGIFWAQQNIIGLRPVIRDGEIKLEIDPIENYLIQERSFPVSQRHIGGYEICLYDNDLYQNPAARDRLDTFLPDMRAALAAIAARGASHRGHGFAFLWKDHFSASLAPYHITLCNFAPFQSLEFLLFDDTEITPLAMELFKIVKEFSPEGHGKSLDDIRRAGTAFVDGFCSPHTEGFHTWRVLRESMVGRSELVSFQAWGSFQEAFFERLREIYADGDQRPSHDDPELGLELVDELVSLSKDSIDLAHIYFDEEEETEEF